MSSHATDLAVYAKSSSSGRRASHADGATCQRPPNLWVFVENGGNVDYQTSETRFVGSDCDSDHIIIRPPPFQNPGSDTVRNFLRSVTIVIFVRINLFSDLMYRIALLLFRHQE